MQANYKKCGQNKDYWIRLKINMRVSTLSRGDAEPLAKGFMKAVWGTACKDQLNMQKAGSLLESHLTLSVQPQTGSRKSRTSELPRDFDGSANTTFGRHYSEYAKFPQGILGSIGLLEPCLPAVQSEHHRLPEGSLLRGGQVSKYCWTSVSVQVIGNHMSLNNLDSVFSRIDVLCAFRLCQVPTSSI